MMPPDVLAFAHIGDLHLNAPGDRNFADLLALVAQIEMDCAASLDFVVLPGDNADHGLPEQYRMVATALKMLSIPVHALPGDHDMEPGSLAAFHDVLGAAPLPKAVTLKGYRCLFLDVSGRGRGGPDFRLGADQMAWVERELEAARQAGQTGLVFMHTYPADLKGLGEAARLTALLAAHDVALVDMGHTHYNELANDGRTIFAATRSTGQIDEGPVGYSVVTLDDGIVGWRFKALADAFPFVIVTAPADHRLARGARQAVADGTRCEVHALVLDCEDIAGVACQVEDGPWQPMRRISGSRLWVGDVTLPDTPTPALTVRATTMLGRPGQHTIRPATGSFTFPQRPADGSDAATIGAWPDNGILGTQLGPNRNGRHW